MYANPHSAYIDQRIATLKKSAKWNIKITETSHEEFVANFAHNVFTNLIKSTFTNCYVSKHKCSDCGESCKLERCHGVGEGRPELMFRALRKVYPDTSGTVVLKEVVIAFLEEHKTTRFTFKCKACHAKETSLERYPNTSNLRVCEGVVIPSSP
jgi:hypothetical protein